MTTATITLETPITRGDTTITTIELRKPRAGELMQLDTGSVMKLIPRISSPTLVDHEVAQLDPADLVQMGMEIVSFLMTKAAMAAYPNT